MGLQLPGHVLLGPGFSHLYVFFILTLVASWSPQPAWLCSRCQYVIYSFLRRLSDSDKQSEVQRDEIPFPESQS